MSRTAINPDSMYNSVQFGFSHAVESQGGRLLHLAGQEPADHHLPARWKRRPSNNNRIFPSWAPRRANRANG